MSGKQRLVCLLVAVLLLCVTAIAEVAVEKRCYWCGPLAEQVHRSQRAPPCTRDLQETTCDPGYTHCAVVATSPPYTESRLCVKFYQDECYSLYCNSSKTWRMICPCQGNLCNGQNTDREIKAFATLAKIVVKNKRNKRALIGDRGLIITPRNMAANHKSTSQIAKETNNLINHSLTANETTHSAMLYDEQIEDYNKMVNATDMTEIVDNKNIEENIIPRDSEDEMQGDQPANEQNETNSTESVEDKNIEGNTIPRDSKEELQGDQPANEQNETNEVNIIPFDHQISTIHDGTNIEDMAKSKLDEIKDNITPAMTLPEINNDINEIIAHTTVTTVKETEDMITHTSVIPTAIEIEVSVIHNQDPKDNLPPPEAIHYNDTPAEVTKTTVSVEVTTERIETTTHLMKETTNKHIELNELTKKAQEPENNNKKNGEEKNLTHIWNLILLMNILIYFCL